MSIEGNGSHAALVQLKAYLAQSGLTENGRLPAERELCNLLGVSRGDLRKALAFLEEEGQIWRHVGKGTFVGSGPIAESVAISEISARANPAAVMRARLIIEPEIAREAALHATPEDVNSMRRSMALARAADTWRQYENFDNLLHRQIAEASANVVLVGLFDALNAIRRAVVWGRLREEVLRPPADHHSFAEHEAIVDAVAQRDLEGATKGMRVHLQSVARKLLPLREVPDLEPHRVVHHQGVPNG